jgi:NAD-dependent DNA ligase
MRLQATNRQKKLLRFFGVSFGPSITMSAASWEIDGLMASEENRLRWDQYKYLTRDFDRESDDLRPFSEDDLRATVVPVGWDSADETRRSDEEFVARVVGSDSPFDRPEPAVQFKDCDFVFTGKFAFGSRKACEAAVASRGGRALSSVTGQVEYLVVGTLGSPAWSRGAYGSKIEQAVLLRREHGRPAIVSEEHWAAALEQQGDQA